MKQLLSIAIILSSKLLIAQGDLILDNADIIIENSTAYVKVNGDVQFNANTTLYNDGTVSLENDWINNSLSPAIDPTTTGVVVLSGLSQDITGSNTTNFYNLKLKNNDAVKSAQINTNIVNELDLGESILEINEFLVHLQNPLLASLTWTTGFISGQNLEGYFLRSTNQTNPYAFPVGNLTLTNDYRAVEIIPTTNDSSVFGVRLGAVDASTDLGVSAAGSSAPFSLNSKEASLGELNDTYYHSIYKFYGSSEANASIYYFDIDAESVFTTAGKWSTMNNEWKDDKFVINPIAATNKPEYGSPNKVATSGKFLTYSDDVYALSEIEILFPTGFSPNGDGFNDVFVIENLDQYPDNEIEIYNRWGELIYQASPYLNDWNGQNTSNGVKLRGDQVSEDTYFYILKLNKDIAPIKNYLELRID